MSRRDPSPSMRPVRGTLWVLAFGGVLCLVAWAIAALGIVVTSVLSS